MYSRRSIYDKSGSLSIPPDYSGTSMRQRTYLGKNGAPSQGYSSATVKSGAMPPPEYRRQWDVYPRIPTVRKDDREDKPGRAPFGDDRSLGPDTPSNLKPPEEITVNTEAGPAADTQLTQEKASETKDMREIRTDDVLLAALLVLLLGDAERNKEAVLLLALLFMSSGIL